MKKGRLKPAFLLFSFMLQRTNLLCSSSLQGEKRFC
jgi:hypothetical protein